MDRWLNTADEMLTFIEGAKYKFDNGTTETRRSILSTLGSDLILKDKILNIDIEKSLFPIKRVSKTVAKIKERLEPVKTVDKQREFDRLCSQSLIMREWLDAFRTVNLKQITYELSLYNNFSVV